MERAFAFYGDLLLHCWHGGEASASTDAGKGEEKHPKKLRAALAEASGRASHRQPPTAHARPGEGLPCSRGEGKSPAPGSQPHPKAARILPAWETGPGQARSIPHHSHKKTPKTTEKVTAASGYIYIFFFWLHFIYYPVSHSHRISNYRATYSQIF